MNSNIERFAVLLKASKGAVNEYTSGIIRLCLTQFMSYGRAKRFVRNAVHDNRLKPTYRDYTRFQRLYAFLPSSPAIRWGDHWNGFKSFFSDESHDLYSFDDLHWKVRNALMNGELESTWNSYFEWRKRDPRCHSRPRLMKGFLNTDHFFWRLERPNLFCFGVLRLIVRYAVEFQGLEPTWRAYAQWSLGGPRCHSRPRLMKEYTNQSDFFGVECGTPKRKRSWNGTYGN